MRETYKYAWDVLTSPLRFKEITAPTAAQISANTVALYAKDKSGVSNLYFKDDAGVEHDLGAAVTPAALTKIDDTNVTLTLGGSPATALLQATSITVGWTGTLSAARGGTGVGTLADVTAGSSKVSLGGTPTGAAIKAFSIDIVEANITHNNLGGLTAGDPHTQYLLASDAGGRATFVTNWTDLTDGGDTVLHTHSSATAPGHIHGITRLTGDGSTTVFNLLDIAEYMTDAVNDGIGVDDADYTLSSDGSQVTFGTAPLAGNVLHLGYVIASI